ncbi:MAG: hypothetical protein P8P29_03835 [Flavobacteriaceae bacterium]|nr:hypothetical protein [Flavobacteriaceae bacterium]
MKQHHPLDPKVAKTVGVNAALIIWNLSYLQSQRESQGGDEFYHEGKWWVRHSYESLAEWHSYLSVDQVRRIMRKLEDSGHVAKSHLGKNPWDRTTYWHVNSVFVHVAKSPDACDGIAGSDVAKSPDVQHKNNSKQDDVKFDEFWLLYPKKVDKKNSRAKFIKLPDNEQQLAIAYLKRKPFKDTLPKFIYAPSKFIHGARWEDELTTERKPKIL